MNTVLCAINAKYIHTNLAVRCLSAYAGEVSVLEFTTGDPAEKIYERLLAENADIYCFSCYIWNISIVRMLCELLRKAVPACCIVLGGPEVSFEEDSIVSWGTVSHIITGEGELALSKLLQCLREGGQAPQIIRGEPADLDSLPFPYEHEVFDGKILYYEASRGCPFCCSYCLSADVRLRLKDLAAVKRDLTCFVARKAHQVKFVDRTFNANTGYAKELFAYIISLNGATNFHCEIAGHLLDDETMDLLKTAPRGMFQFEIGVQSTNEDTLDRIRRKTDLGILKKRVTQLKSFGNIHIHLDLIAGLPGENLSSFIRSFEETYSLEPDMLQLGFLKLLKGSELRKSAATLGIVYASFAPYEVISTPDLSAMDLLLLKKCEKGLEFYNSGRYRCSLRYASAQCGPFRFYKLLGERVFAAQGTLSLKDKTIELFRCGLEAGFPTEIWKEIVRYDYLLHEKKSEYLEEIGFVQNDEARLRLRQIICGDGTTGRQLHLEAFAFDVPAYVNGELYRDNVHVLFDYRLQKADTLM